jgi:hypothetical protein
MERRICFGIANRDRISRGRDGSSLRSRRRSSVVSCKLARSKIEGEEWIESLSRTKQMGRRGRETRSKKSLARRQDFVIN